MRSGRGSDVVRRWFGGGSDVFRIGADSLAEVKGKWFPAMSPSAILVMRSHMMAPEQPAKHVTSDRGCYISFQISSRIDSPKM